ncbi:hypothetical protein I312_105176 [Cryptococcus bacillisporus CA1280]|uniref:BRCT domain-containing protein n=1 Tax=Cryptococcus bacillisporus CA1280 TaxID=1296109 RepID=A0A0D0ULG1_CRYGA|nr:hypothetical protein I312_01169 [Cryptococcus bacillisporus CA1280]
MLVTRTGGGVLAPSSSAAITILPLSRGQPAVESSHFSAIYSIEERREPSWGVMPLQDWVLDCIDTEQLLGMEDYLVEVGDVGDEDVEMELRGREAEEGEMGMNPATDRMDNLKRKLVNEGERETKRQLTVPDATD